MIQVLVPGRILRTFRAELPHPDELVLRMFEPDGATVHGTVRDPDGKAIAGAKLVVEAQPRRIQETPGATAMTVSTADGTWRVEGLPPVELTRVIAEAEGHCGAEVRGHGRRLTAGGEVAIPLVLHRGATLRGLVVDRESRPLPGAAVWVQTLSSASGPSQTRETTVDAQGRFRIAAVLAGAVVVSAFLDGYYTPNQSADEVEVHPLQENETKEITLVLARGIPVQGCVVDADGMPVPDVRVRAEASADPRFNHSFLLQHARYEARTTERGTFHFAGLAPGETWSFRATEGRLTGTTSLSGPLDEAGVAELEIVLRGRASIAGRIVDEAGAPVGLAALRWRPGAPAVSAWDGTFRLEGLDAGRYHLKVFAPFSTLLIGEVSDVAVDWGEVKDDIEVVVPAGLPIEGTLVDAEGSPVPRATLQFVRTAPRGEGKIPTGTDPEGRFTTRVWEEGTYVAEHEGVRLPLSITPPQTDVELVLPAAEAAEDVVTFRIVAPDRSPVPRVRLIVKSGYGDTYRRARHEVDGGVVVVPRHDLPGPTFVQVEWARDAAGEMLNLRDLAETEVDTAGDEVLLALEEGRVLRGMVTSNKGVPIADAGVYASAPGERNAQGSRTDASGRFEIAALPDGELEVTASMGVGASPYLPCVPVRVAAGQREVDLELVEGAFFAVRVLGPEGEAVAGANVSVMAQRKGRRWARRGMTGEDGCLRLGGLAEDATFTIDVRSKSFPQAHLEDVPYGTGETTVHLTAGVTIEGVVVDEDGQPVPRASIRAKPLDAKTFWKSGRTEGETNHFALMALEPGRYELTASAHGRFAASKPVVVTAPARGVRLVVRPIREVTGRVTGGTLHRATGSWWVGDSMTSVVIGADGTFSVPRTADDPGTFVVMNHETGECGFVENVKPTDGPFDIVMRPARVVAGRIEGFERLGSQRAQLAFLRGPIRWGGTIEPDGTFEQKCLPPGRWRVEVRAGGKTTGVDVDLAPGTGRVDLALTLPE